MPVMLCQRFRYAIRLAAALGLIGLLACSGGDAPEYANHDAGSSDVAPPTVIVPALSEPAQAGQTAFNANCALCHGANAAGTNLGPPLVHKIYEPNHHQDFAFRNAVQNGVQSHHWQFGNMPAAPQVSEADVERIICYVRELQRANGIFDDAAGLAACQP